MSQLVSYTGFAVVLFAGVGVASLFVLRRREPDAPRPFRAWGYPWAPGVFVLASLAMVVNEIIRNGAPALAGLAVIARACRFTTSSPGLRRVHRVKRADRRTKEDPANVFAQALVSAGRTRSVDALQIALIGDRLAGSNHHVELLRLVSLGLHFDLVRAGFDRRAAGTTRRSCRQRP